MAAKIKDHDGTKLLNEVMDELGLLPTSAHWTMQMISILVEIEFVGSVGDKVVPNDVSYADFVRKLDTDGAELIRGAAKAWAAIHRKAFTEAPSEVNDDGVHAMSYVAGDHTGARPDLVKPGFGDW